MAAGASVMSRVRHFGRHSLLWLALVLAMPLAQGAAIWHQIGHGGTGAAAAASAPSANDDGGAHAQTVCGQCLAAAAFAAASPAPLPAAVEPPPAAALVAERQGTPAPAVAPARAYRSRAPPSLRIDR
ncbi:MAG: hypothetical protein KGL78_09440 [Burkholderiales bacterium]|nr:hypothetical protein [Burkholderiales bacterium]